MVADGSSSPSKSYAAPGTKRGTPSIRTGVTVIRARTSSACWRMRVCGRRSSGRAASRGRRAGSGAGGARSERGSRLSVRAWLMSSATALGPRQPWGHRAPAQGRVLLGCNSGSLVRVRLAPFPRFAGVTGRTNLPRTNPRSGSSPARPTLVASLVVTYQWIRPNHQRQGVDMRAAVEGRDPRGVHRQVRRSGPQMAFVSVRPAQPRARAAIDRVPRACQGDRGWRAPPARLPWPPLCHP